MKHPILSRKGYKFYLIIWAMVMLAHFFVLYFAYQIELKPAIFDSLLYNLLFMGLGLGLWYVVYFSFSNSKSTSSYIINHLIAALLTVALWTFFPKSVLDNLNQDNAEYLLFLKQSLLWRGLIGLLFYCVIVLIYYLMEHYEKLQQKIKEESELKTMITEAELNSLKSQINPHFIFNCLNSINALTLSAPDKASEMVVKLSDYLRYSINKGNQEVNSLKEELDNINLYLNIEKVRFGDKLNFTMKVEKGCDNAMVPNMILQPLVENAIKYGVHESLDSVDLNLSCRFEDHYLEIRVSNNYDIDTHVSNEGSGIGLKNIQKRLELIYGSGELISIDNKDQVFEVKVLIPLNEN